MRFPDLRRRPLLVSVAALAAIRFSIVYLDRPIARMLVDVPRWLTDLAEWVTGFGRSDRYLIPLAMAVVVLGLAARYRKDLQGRIAARRWAWTAGFVFLSIALSGLLNDVVKLIAGRPRPRIPALDNEPSAESTPGAERKPTIAAWLDQLATKLERCTDREEVEGLLLSDEVCRAGRTLRGAARERLRELMDAGWPSTAEP